MVLLRKSGFVNDFSDTEFGQDLNANIDARADTLDDAAATAAQTAARTRDMTGADAVAGAATLVAGTVTVATTEIKTGDNVLITRKTLGGTPGNLSLGTIVADTSFVINSSSNTDTSVVFWEIVRAAA